MSEIRGSIIKPKLIVPIILLFIFLIVWAVLRGSEDDWIQDSRGVWIKHGQPAKTPSYVSEQEELIKKANWLYEQAKASNQDLSSGLCLGSIADDWVADIAHSPRQAVDDQPENQCSAFREGQAHHFIELDPEGNIIKIY